MTTRFAALEKRANDAVIRHLANATAFIEGVAVDGIFRNQYAEFSNVIGGSNPTFQCRSADVSAVIKGTALTINNTHYQVASAPQPDGAGMTLLQLEEV
ncbi:hypothetical protein [Nitrosomonas sp. Nm34]|uniref:head-tail joining protein n=1 Tax=Nitrosomonas sp. Nm34 TaxID=1881055 RepID=UPI0008EBCE1E|nr:hypothetical protein [Nitrosomonas sp. Nm34]SFJ04399.1 hypothetical protein SAMN05428978_10889 [Nitrosomonas sp. Nm34]